MHVLYVIDSLALGGAELSLATMAPYYAASGITLDVAYLRERPGLQDALRAAGASVFSVAGNGGRIGSIRRVQRLIGSRRPDLIHTTLFEADLTGRIAGTVARVPVVSSLVSAMYGEEHLGNPALRRWKVRAAQGLDILTARLVVRFHATSAYVAEQMSRRLRLQPERIDVVHRGRDPIRLGVRSPARRAEARVALGAASQTPVLLAVGRHVYAKGFDVLLEAFPLVLAERPDAKLYIVGPEAQQTTQLRDAVSRTGLGDAVAFLGVRNDVPDLLCAADVFVLPSRREGLPGVLLEAMALEAPIVATDIPANREVLADDGTALVGVEEAAALAAAIRRTLDDPAGSARRTARSRARFLAHFTAEQAAAGMFRFYAKALGASAPTGRRTAIGGATSR